MVFIGTNGLRPAVGGGNNDNFFHGESRVIRYDDHDKDDYDIIMVVMITMMATMTMIMKVKYHDFCKFRPPVENAQRIDNEHPCGNTRLRERENLKHKKL